MIQNLHNLSSRDKQIICGLFLSKYDQAALQYLDFEGFIEAFNTLGYSLGAKPASIKNYRDELDPYFPNKRQGWHKRPLRQHCKCVMETYGEMGIDEMGKLIKGFVCPDEELRNSPKISQVLQKHTGSADSSFAKRLITGKAAEEYFLANCGMMPEFAGHIPTDTTQWGCGFDFKMTGTYSDTYLAVEVKGLRGRTGQMQFTALEYEMAETLAERYYLVAVRNFSEQPFHSIFRNPLQSDLSFERIERTEVRVSWLADIAR